jgi:ABC-2 type transport system ATP-binding protein
MGRVIAMEQAFHTCGGLAELSSHHVSFKSSSTQSLLVLQVQALTKRFAKTGSPAVDSLDFEVRNGEVVGFVGLNGAGKSTTIRIAAGIALPTAGTILVDGHDIVHDKVEASKSIGWVPETPNFEPSARGLDLLRYFAGFHGIPSPAADSRSGELFRLTGLSGAERKRFREYSQGMKKRLALAAAMLANPRNYLFDEVLNGLDPEGIRFFRGLVGGLKDQGKAVLLSSHILLEVEGLADRVVFIHKGKLVKVVTRSDLAAFENGSITMVVENVDENLAERLRGMGEVRMDGKSVTILDFKGDRAELNYQLAKEGYHISDFTVQKLGLEDYFLRLIGEVK